MLMYLVPGPAMAVHPTNDCTSQADARVLMMSAIERAGETRAGVQAAGTIEPDED